MVSYHFLRRLNLVNTMKLNHPTGIIAENLALCFLQSQGLRLVIQNWHCRFGELDLVMLEQHTYVFVEVKYRKNTHFGGAIQSISASKYAKLVRAAECYLQTHRIQAPSRIDAILLQDGCSPVWLKNISG